MSFTKLNAPKKSTLKNTKMDVGLHLKTVTEIGWMVLGVQGNVKGHLKSTILTVANWLARM